MSITQQTLPRGTGLKYSIPQLLRLSRCATSGFDLAKFTYDAARAGVVPPLGECAIQPLRASNTCSRNWSSEGTDSTVEIATSSGNTSQQPFRQPVIPPPEALAQTNLGFARFLKKHSSPNHQRVTARGRIVPMEQRGTPPPFSLANHSQRYDMTSRNLQRANAAQMNQYDTAMRREGQPSSHILPASVAPLPGVTTASMMGLPSYTNGYFVDQMRSAFGPASSPFQQIAGYPSTYLAPATLDHASPPPPSPLLTDPMSAVGFHPHNPYLGYVAPVPMWSATYMPAGTNESNAVGAINPASAQQVLDHAKAQFEMLDNQLKDIDRFRATGEHDPVLAHQRMSIVEQRSSAKDYITYLRKTFGLEQGQTFYSPPPNQTNWNVGAPEYVPAHRPGPQMANFHGCNPQNVTRQTQTSVLDLPRQANHAVSMITPPDEGRDLDAPQENDVASPEQEQVDGWGARLGCPPPEIQRQQDALLAAMTAGPRDANDAHDNDACDAVEEASEAYLDDIPDTASVSSSVLEERKARIPQSEIEAAYERQLDALRKPAGVITRVVLANGSRIDLHGQNLQRPPSSQMTPFEEDYWRRKSAWSFNEMPPRTQQSYQDSDSMNHRPIGAGDSLLSAGLRYKENSMQTEGRVGSRNMNRESDVLSDVFHPNQGGSHEYDSNLPRSRDPRNKRPATSPIHMDYTSDRFDMGDLDDFPADPMNNKGFTSVSFQNVTAIGSLPSLYVDGSTDGNRRSAQAMLANASKATSPIMRRRTGRGGI